MKNSYAARGMTSARAAVLDVLLGQPDPVGVNAVSAATGSHPNTVREHLTWLVDRGLVVRYRTVSEGRGRPAWLYEAVGPRPGEGDHAEVAAALAWQIREQTLDPAQGSPAEQAREAGRAWGRDMCRTRPTTARERPEAAWEKVVAVMADLGFQPVADKSLGHVRLTRCPLLQAAHANQAVVCSMHVGLVQSVLAHYGADEEVVELTPFAEAGACLLRLDGPSS